jgi:hypothetical protein
LLTSGQAQRIIKRFQLRAPRVSPQPLLAAQALVERHGLQPIHDPRARLHHAMPMPQQLPQIAVLPARHPDPREAILHQQTQDQLRVLPIRLLLAYALRPNLGRVSDPQLKLQLGYEALEPTRVPARLHPHPYFLTRQSTVKSLRLFRMA